MIDSILPLRLVQFLLPIICLGLIGSTIGFFTGLESGVAESIFMLFVSAWTLVFVPYLTLAPIFLERFANKVAILALDTFTMLIWFAAFVTLAVWRGDYGTCHYGSGECKRVTAAIVFGALEGLLFTATTVLAALHVYKTRGCSVSKPTAHAGVQSGGGMATV